MKKFLSYFRKILFNKYFLTIVIFAVIVIFFGNNSLRNRWKTGKDIKSLNKEINFYQNEIQSNKQKMNDMQSGDENLERYAREKYYLKKDSEDLFIIKEDE
ncbi:MAG: septum formation initiator family protein [Paludibacteraceae bacterium]